MIILEDSAIFSATVLHKVQSKYVALIQNLRVKARNVNLEIFELIRYSKSSNPDLEILNKLLEYIRAKNIYVGNIFRELKRDIDFDITQIKSAEKGMDIIYLPKSNINEIEKEHKVISKTSADNNHVTITIDTYDNIAKDYHLVQTPERRKYKKMSMDYFYSTLKGKKV